MRSVGLIGALAMAGLLAGCATDPAAVPTPDASAKQEAAPAADAADTGTRDMAENADAKSRANQLRKVIEQAARDNAIPVALAHAVIRIESNYNWKIVHAGNYGLMQIKLATARSLGFVGTPAALLDPATNLRFGLKYLAGAYQRTGGDLCLTIMKYQSGHRALRMSGANRKYCQRVKSLMASWT
jgi:soluble lytic murein transglycosylase-like protein